MIDTIEYCHSIGGGFESGAMLMKYKKIKEKDEIKGKTNYEE